MAEAYKVIRATSPEDLVLMLDRAIVSGKNLHDGANVNGKTLIFSTPAATVTFSGTDPLSLKDIVDQINAVISGAAAIKIVVPPGSTGVTPYRTLVLTRGSSQLVLSGGTANSDLGLPSSASQVPYGAGRVRMVGRSPDNQEYYAIVSSDSPFASITLDGVNIENANLEVHVEAEAEAGQEPDSLIAAGTENGLLAGVVHYMRVHQAASISETDHLLATHDPSLGRQADAAVTTDVSGTAIGFLRGLIRRASDAALGLFVTGTVAHDNADAGAPVKTGGHGTAAPRTAASTDGDRVDASADLRGRLRSRVSGENNAAAGVDAIVDTGTSVTEANNLLGVKDPSVGVTTGAAVITDAAGTLQQFLRGLVVLLRIQRAIGPINADISNQAVTTASAVTFTVVGGNIVEVVATEEMTMIWGGTAPTSTTGAIVPADTPLRYEVPAGVTQVQFIATATNGRVSVSVLN